MSATIIGVSDISPSSTIILIEVEYSFFKSFDVLANNNNVVIMMGHLGNATLAQNCVFFSVKI